MNIDNILKACMLAKEKFKEDNLAPALMLEVEGENEPTLVYYLQGQTNTERTKESLMFVVSAIQDGYMPVNLAYAADCFLGTNPDGEVPDDNRSAISLFIQEENKPILGIFQPYRIVDSKIIWEEQMDSEEVQFPLFQMIWETLGRDNS